MSTNNLSLVASFCQGQASSHLKCLWHFFPPTPEKGLQEVFFQPTHGRVRQAISSTYSLPLMSSSCSSLLPQVLSTWHSNSFAFITTWAWARACLTGSHCKKISNAEHKVKLRKVVFFLRALRWWVIKKISNAKHKVKQREFFLGGRSKEGELSRKSQMQSMKLNQENFFCVL